MLEKNIFWIHRKEIENIARETDALMEVAACYWAATHGKGPEFYDQLDEFWRWCREEGVNEQQ